jgi:hypothetical protein
LKRNQSSILFSHRVCNVLNVPLVGTRARIVDSWRVDDGDARRLGAAEPLSTIPSRLVGLRIPAVPDRKRFGLEAALPPRPARSSRALLTDTHISVQLLFQLTHTSQSNEER